MSERILVSLCNVVSLSLACYLCIWTLFFVEKGVMDLGWLLGGFPCRLHTVAHFIEAMCHASMLQDVRFHRVMQTLEDDFDDVRTEI